MKNLVTFFSVVLTSACLVPVRDTVLGTADAGGSAGGQTGGNAGGGLGGSGGTGDATCDQSACLGTEGLLNSLRPVGLWNDGDALVATVLPAGGSFLEVVRIDKATGAQHRLLRAGASNVLQGRVKRVGDFVYFADTLSGEIFGLPARVKVNDGTLEAIGNVAPFGSGSPTTFAFDTDGIDYAFVNNQQLFLGTWPFTTAPVSLAALGAEQVNDVLLLPTEVLWVGDGGLHRVPRAGGLVENLVPGTSSRLRQQGGAVYFMGAASGTRGIYALSAQGQPSLVVQGAFLDFAAARGTVFGVTRTGEHLQVLDAASAVVMDVVVPPPTGSLETAALEVDAARLFLGTVRGTFFKTEVAGTAACGCAPPTLALPAPEAPACTRSLCSQVITLSGTLLHGVSEAGTLFGTFTTPSFTQELQSMNVLSTATFSYGITSGGPVALDSASVYGADVAGLQQVPRAGGTPTVLAASAQPTLMAVDAQHVYWVDGSEHSLKRVPKAGGSPETVVAGLRVPQALVLDESNVYWVDDDQVWRQGKAATVGALLASGLEGAAGLALEGTFVYFVTVRGLERVPQTGGFKSLVLPRAALPAGQVLSVSIQGGEAVLTMLEGSTTSVSRVDLQTRAVEGILSTTSSNTFSSVAAPDGFALGQNGTTLWRTRGCSCP